MLGIDLRSDTVTLPTTEMKEEMINADLGDDGYQDDPTVRSLEKKASKMFGKDCALLVPSGTMGNLLAIKIHCSAKNELIVGEWSHIQRKELPPIKDMFNVLPRTVMDRKGCLDLQKCLSLINTRTGMISIENTHNHEGGAVVPLSHFQQVYHIAKKSNVNVHLDGARIFNATVAAGISPREYGKYVDSIMFCLSKGLSAPIGSVLVGSKEFIGQARKWRKYLGGGMRQAGIIAAPGIVGLQNMVDRLEQDHWLAKRLAKGLTKIEGIKLELQDVETNIVIAEITSEHYSAEDFVHILAKKGIYTKCIKNNSIRMIINRHITEKDINVVLKTINAVLNDRHTKGKSRDPV